MKRKITSKKGLGVSKRSSSPKIGPNVPVRVHLLVTRESGDEERYLIGEVPNMLMAIDYKRKLLKVPIPKKLRRASDGYKSKKVFVA